MEEVFLHNNGCATVLIVDADQTILSAFKKLLFAENINAYTLSHVEDVDKVIAECKPDILILNIQNYGRISASFVKFIKNLYPEMIVIAMTSYSNIFTERLMTELGADAYIKKPFDINDMLIKVKSYICLVDKESDPESSLSA